MRSATDFSKKNVFSKVVGKIRQNNIIAILWFRRVKF